ncbi:MAG: proteasome assembly chaperone family protein [Candidatus Thermoplasmatota archaeon]|nr:proteasome assembly chaperone family protein [Candidatus Thermoplasmatota archaeon]MCL5962925.1 proteasome assembly chaperone family protein [Candidatus Thermoplasmatota archaeon]
MEDVIINFLKDVKLRNPILIQGLPGVGNVGKLAVDYMKDELKSIKFADIISKYFPPQVLIDHDGTIRLVNNELYYYKHSGSGKGNDLIMVVGDYQSLTPEGQYELADRIIRIAKNMNVKRIYTLAGYAHNDINKNIIKIWGATNNKTLIKEMEKHGVIFKRDDYTGSLVGASGLLLGIGLQYGIDAVCLMGETSGYFIDPKSAETLLKVFIKILGINLKFENLQKKAKEIDKITQKFQDIEDENKEDKDILNYFA